ELFGHEKGAFTGASAQRVGRFEQCHKGTIFLDEIGDMSLATQTKILRVLQSGTFERVGGNETIHADVRVIAATNQPLEQAVAERRFREDLFYRLNVVRIAMPPLRARMGDVPLLVNYFLKRFTQARAGTAKAVSAEVLTALETYRWPGNVRELENVVRRATVVAKGDTLLVGDLPLEVRTATPPATAPPASAAVPPPGAVTTPAPPPSITPAAVPTPATPTADIAVIVAQLFAWARQHPKLKLIPAVERELVLNALKETRGNQVQAAKLLGVTRATLRKRMEKFGVRSELTFQ
ncbi:MAG: sigma-54-dependent Fis family transcriptional regulator, partial [Verrucomicrobiae bacterium]|nr:sigma-54-dependent Fis family transcriptional regulator [Verrucomicrobiae bacterium]